MIKAKGETLKRTLHATTFGFRHSDLISPSFLLHDYDLARKFFLRQGLWTEGLRTPPEQECSNGSLILLAVVLWRTFFGKDSRVMKDADCSNETPESKDIALSRGYREMR